jgi:hypothetical protein
MPVIEKDTGELDIPIEKYRCPNCADKELPFLHYRIAAGYWNLIAPVRNHIRHTLKYNIHGACMDEPCRVFEWRDRKKAFWHVTVKFYLDNGLYSYCYDYWYGSDGEGCGMGLGDPRFPSMEAAKEHAVRGLSRMRREIAGIVEELLLAPVQGGLFQEEAR